jgi:hypothetical protein
MNLPEFWHARTRTQDAEKGNRSIMHDMSMEELERAARAAASVMTR